jgi:hypothetical protein
MLHATIEDIRKTMKIQSEAYYLFVLFNLCIKEKKL